MTERELSRRMLLHGVAATGLGVLAGAPVAAQVQTKSPQQAAGYQNHPNGNQSCGNCQQFQPPSSCKVVAGRVSPSGWCKIYLAKQG